MDIDYKSVISFRPLKNYLNENGLKIKYLAERIGQDTTRVSAFVRDVAMPKTDLIGKMCAVLKVRASKIVEFRGIEVKPYFSDKELPYMPPLDATGEVTYRPLWEFLAVYLDEHEGKTANDLFDKIEPPRRRNKIKVDNKGVTAAHKSLGYGENYIPKTKRSRPDYSRGLTQETRTKLRNDRPLNIRAIYDICLFLGCSIDWILSYK